MKALITADLHIHAHKADNRRVEDGLDCLKWIYETATQNGCERVIFAGDFLHNRFSLNVLAYAKASQIIVDYADRMPTIFVLGNHDLYSEDNWDIHSLVPFCKWATVVDRPTTLKMGKVPVDFLPYTPIPSKHLPAFKSGANVLISHLAILSAKLHAKFDILSVEDDSKEKEVIPVDAFDAWDKVWLGHYHYGQKLGKGNVEYIGSPMQLTFGEAGQTKHVAVFDFDTLETTYVENNLSPKFHIIESEDAVNGVDVTNCYVEMRTKESIQGKFDLRKRLAKLGAREIEFVSKARDLTKATKALNNIVEFVHQTEKMIEVFVNGMQLKTALDRQKLIQIGVEIVKSEGK
jgi:DNA repair exonuclease SbcCD nuclease subunit